MKYPAPMNPNEIEAIYLDMRNKGQDAYLQLGGPILTLSQWRDRELVRWHEYMESELARL